MNESLNRGLKRDDTPTATARSRPHPVPPKHVRPERTDELDPASRAPERGDSRHRALAWAIVVSSALPLSGCEVVGGIFKAGFWVGIIVVVAVVGAVGFAVSKLLT